MDRVIPLWAEMSGAGLLYPHFSQKPDVSCPGKGEGWEEEIAL